MMEKILNSFYNSFINTLLLTILFIIISTISFFIKSREHSFSITINEKQVVAERRINELEEDNVKLIDVIKKLEVKSESEEKQNKDLLNKIKGLEKDLEEVNSKYLQLKNTPTKSQTKFDCNVAWYLKNKYGKQNKFFEPYLRKNAPTEVYNAIFNCK